MNNVTMMSDDHSNTANGITVLGTGPSKPIIFERPTSSGRRSTTPKLLQRSGSTLETLPIESEVSIISISKDNHQMSVANTKSMNSARSSSRDGKRNGADTKSMKLNSSDACSAHKKVVLPSVKRDFEKHGMPNNEQFESFVRSTTPMKDSEQKSYSTVSSLETGIHGIQLETKLSVRTDSVKHVTSLSDDDDDYHHSQSESNNEVHSNPPKDVSEPETSIKQKSKSNDEKIDNSAKTNSIKQVTSLNDDYYISHSLSDSYQRKSQKDDTELETSVTFASETSTQKPLKVDDDDDIDESDDDDEEEKKAPIELYGEFLEAVMEEDFENAQKLCQMILIYEPDNKEANEFKPLIDEELRKERERQLWGSSSSEEESSDEEDTDEQTDDSDDDDEDDDGSNGAESDEDSN